MKKLFFPAIAALLSLNCMAVGTDVISFECLDGSKHSIQSENLEITFADGKVNATNGTENVVLPLNTVRAFYFGTSSGISNIQAVTDGKIDVYDIAGAHRGTYCSLSAARQTLPAGTYIVKSGKNAIKMSLK